jgi:hypothetical protein
MRYELQGFLIIVLVLSIAVYPSQGSSNFEYSDSICPNMSKERSRTIQSSRGVCVHSSLNRDTLQINVHNPTEEFILEFRYAIIVGEVRFQKRYFDLRPEKRQEVILI